MKRHCEPRISIAQRQVCVEQPFMKHAQTKVLLTVSAAVMGLFFTMRQRSVEEPRKTASPSVIDHNQASNILYQTASQKLQAANPVCIWVTNKLSGWQGAFMRISTNSAGGEMLGVTISLDTMGNFESCTVHDFCKTIAPGPVR